MRSYLLSRNQGEEEEENEEEEDFRKAYATSGISNPLVCSSGAVTSLP